MLQNVNQVCGVLALIVVACLVAFGSAGDRIVTAAPGQIGPAGDTGTAIAIGGCNRCAWSLGVVDVDLAYGEEVDLLPPGTSGVFRGFVDYSGSVLTSTFAPGGVGAATFFTRRNYDARFTNGVRFKSFFGGQLTQSITFLYRLD